MTPEPLSEAAFQLQVVELAALFGFESVHFRPARTAHGWRTPVQGPLGKGWPDLVLLRRRDGRLIFAELKSDGGKVTPEQRDVLNGLACVEGVECHVWRPSDLERIAAEVFP